MDALEQTLARGNAVEVEIRFSAKDKDVGDFSKKSSVRRKIIEALEHGTEVEAHDIVQRRRKDANGSTAAPGEVTAMIISLIIEGLFTSSVTRT
jgi:hypothetical protein